MCQECLEEKRILFLKVVHDIDCERIEKGNVRYDRWVVQFYSRRRRERDGRASVWFGGMGSFFCESVSHPLCLLLPYIYIYIPFRTSLGMCVM